MADQTTKINQWVKEAQEGRESSFVNLYDHFVDKVFRFVSFRVADRELAKELTNEIFFEAWRSLKRYNHNRAVRFSTWLFTIARYRVIDQYRRRKLPTISLDEVAEIRNENDNLHEKVVGRDQFELIQGEIGELPEIQQTVLQLRYLEGMSYAEISQITDKSEGHLRVIVKRALEKLKNTLKKEIKEDG